jgi:hypothetical protein
MFVAGVTHRTSSVIVAAVLVCAAVTSCSADTAPGFGSAPSAVGSTPVLTPVVTPSPSPSGDSCADGTCQVEVTVGDVVTVPERYGLGPIEVTAIGDAEVGLTASLTGSGYSMSGCSGGGGVFAPGGGGVEMSCRVGVLATINDAMILEVVEIDDRAAVLRIAAAK